MANIKSFKIGKLKISNVKRIKSSYYKKKGTDPFYRNKKYIYTYRIKFPGRKTQSEGWIPGNCLKDLKDYFRKYF